MQSPGFGAVQPSGRSPFPPIADYAFLSDCEVNCLVAPSGAVEWMCLPRPDSPSVFTAMLDRGAGAFRLGPYDEMVPAARRYLPGSLMVETTWQTRTGWLIVRDALCMGPWHNVDERSRTHRRSPTDFDAEHCLLRTVRCVSGSVDLSMTCEPVVRLRPARADVARTRATATARSSRRATDVRRHAAADHRPATRHRGSRAERADPDGRGRHPLRRAVLVAAAAAADAGRGRRPGCGARRSTGGSGSRWATSRTTRGAATCSAAR